MSLDVLLRRIIDTVTEVLGAERGSLFLNDTERGELYSRVVLGDVPREIRFPNHLGIAGSVFSTGNGEIIADACTDKRFNRKVDKKPATGLVMLSVHPSVRSPGTTK